MTQSKESAESAESAPSKIAVRVIAGVLTVGALWALSRIPGLLHWLWEIGVTFFNHLKGTSGLPNWGLYLLVLTAIHSFINIAKRHKKPTGPKVTEYNQDDFLGLIWRWSYIGNTPHDPWAFCPRCDTMLVYTQSGRYDPIQKTVLVCETCNQERLQHDGNKDYLVGKIHRQIDRVIRTGEWTKKINNITQQSA